MYDKNNGAGFAWEERNITVLSFFGEKKQKAKRNERL